MAQPSVAALTKAFIQLRDERTEAKRAFEEEDFKFEQKLEKLEVMMMAKLNEAGVDSFKTEFGTVYTQDETKYKCDDWNSYWQLILDTGRMDLLEKRVAQGAVKALIEEGEELPPGLSYTTKRVVRVRRT